MKKTLTSFLKPLLRSLLVLGLVVTLTLGSANSALAARSSGRIGGGSFRSAPSHTYRAPAPSSRGGYSGGGYGYGYPGGGGFGFPFLIPFFGVGGGFGGLFSILIFIAIANFLVRSFRSSSTGGEEGYGGEFGAPPVSIASLQVGLLAEARGLQAELDHLAQVADTGSTEGLTQVLQETTLALLRHPEHWAYASEQVQQARLEAAEATFNRLALMERSKSPEETLSNVNHQLKQAQQKSLAGGADASSQLVAQDPQDPGEYIVVTLLVAAQGRLQLPAVNAATDLRQALTQLGGVSSEQLLALEILWAPQAHGDTLTAEDLVSAYPNLKLI